MQKTLNEKALDAGIWYTISALFLKASSLITAPIFLRMLTTSEYGQVSVFNVWISTLTVLCSLNLNYSIGRAKLDYKDNLNHYIGAMQILSLISSLCCICLIIVINAIDPALFNMDPKVIFLMMLYLVFEPAIIYKQSGCRFQYKSKENIQISFFICFGGIGLSLLFIFLFDDNAYARILGQVLPIIILSMYIWSSTVRNKELKVNTEYFKYGLKLSVPLIFHKLSLTLLSQSDKMIIDRYCGSSETGLYSFVYQYGAILITFSGIISDAWLPWFHDVMHEKNYSEINNKLKIFIETGCLMGILSLAIGPEAVIILAGKKYSEAVSAVPPIVLGIVTQFFYTHYVNIEMHMKKTKIIAVSTFLSAILNIILNIIFIPLYGYTAAAYTTLAGYLFLLVIHYFNTKIILKVNVYDNLQIFLELIVTFAVSTLFAFVYNNFIIRYLGIAAVTLIYILRNKDFLAGLFLFLKNKIIR